MLEFWMGKTDPTTIENCPTPDLTASGHAADHDDYFAQDRD
jgi:hypothetical protein